MAQYITIADCTKGKKYEFKSNGFKPEYFQFEPFVETKGIDILQEIKNYICDNDYQKQILMDLVDFINPNEMYMFFL